MAEHIIELAMLTAAIPLGNAIDKGLCAQMARIANLFSRSTEEVEEEVEL